MSVIYEPKGRALEYAPLACNLYETCPHGCTYCYVPGAMHKKPCDFHQPARPRKDIIKRLEADCNKMRGEMRPVLLCFACDPFPEYGDRKTTYEALRLLGRCAFLVEVLTKGNVEYDEMMLMQHTGWWFGVSLTGASYKDEPKAATTHERIQNLEKARSLRIRTFVSVEPVINPIVVLWDMERALPYVDHWKVGKLNHRKSDTDWRKFYTEASKLLKGKSVYWKKDLLEAVGAV